MRARLVGLTGADQAGGQDLYPSLLGRSALEGNASVAWGDGLWNGSHGLKPA